MKIKNIHLKTITVGIFLIVLVFEKSIYAQDPYPGNALNFDGIFNYIQCGDSTSIGIGNEMTIETWIKVSSSFPADLRVGIIIGNYDHAPNFNLEGHTSGRLRFLWNGGEVDVYATDFDMRDDSWHHVAVTRDSLANQVIIYTDGQISGVYPAGTNADYQWPLRIGRDFQSNPAFPFNGVIDEVRLWNVARTAQEIRENMHLTFTGSETGLIALWQFNEESGDITYDAVAGNDGTLYNFSSVDRIGSTVPIGSGTSLTQMMSSTGVYELSSTGLTMNVTEKSDTDTIVVSRLDIEPNQAPSNFVTFDNQYWLINKFGSGTITTDIAFTPAETINPIDESSPNALRLFNRASNSDGSWLNMMGGSAASTSNNSVTFNSISSFSQFIIGKEQFSSINAGLTDVYAGSAAWGDYDNDGDLDLLLTGVDRFMNISSRIYRNDAGVFSSISTGLSGSAIGSVDWGDYDNDGDLDILLTGINSIAYDDCTKIYSNDGGVFTDIDAGLPGVSNGLAEWGDYDNDGDLDFLLVGQLSTNNLISRIYRNDSGVFIDINAGLVGVASRSVAWGDYDNDGDLDILLVGIDSTNNPMSRIYRNDAGVFIDINAGLPPFFFGSAAWGDYDNDGDLDILLSGQSDNQNYISGIYRNDEGTFVDINAGLPGLYYSFAAWGDYDNDGDLDIVLTGQVTSDSIISRIYQNNNVVPNNEPLSPDGLTNVISTDSITFSWNKSSDNETPQNGLSYNLMIASSELDTLFMSPMADINTGYRLIPAIGNSCQATSWTYQIQIPESYLFPQVILPYCWGVQAIDHTFAASPFTMKHLSPVSYLQVCNNEVIDLPDTLSWDISHMDSIINYQIQIDNDVTFSSCEVNDILVFLQDTTSADTMYSVILGNLPGSNSLVEGKKYYWRVKPNYTFGLPTTFTDPAPYFYYVYVSTINEPIDAQIPKEYALYQNYPNPFNPVTRIKYALPKSTRVKIWLYDIIGRRIKVLVDDQKPAGYHTLEFNGGNLASGIYMYRIHADNFISTKKMLLIK